MADITTIITTFPPAPDSGSDTPTEFNSKADAFVNHQSGVYVGEVNQWATEANSLKADMNTIKTDIDGIVASIPDGTINDAVITTTSVWSSKKVSDELNAKPSTSGLRNIIINGDMRINQRGFNGSTFVAGEYCWDRWKPSSSQSTTSLTQIIEEGNFIPDTEYTISGTNMSPSQVTSPSSGHWNISVPNTARKIQLEIGSVATPFEQRPIGLELSLCQRYYYNTAIDVSLTSKGTLLLDANSVSRTVKRLAILGGEFPVTMRAIPTVRIGAYSHGAGKIANYSNTASTLTVDFVDGTTEYKAGLYLQTTVAPDQTWYVCNFDADAEL